MGQTVHVKYKKFIVPGHSEVRHWMSSPEMKRNIREREEQIASNVSEYYSLYSNGRRSYFEYDTTIRRKEIKEQDRGWWSNLDELHYSYAKNLQNGVVSIRNDWLADSICRSVNFREKYKWKMTEGEKIFAGLRCQKAYHINEKGDSIVVWFAPELPVPDGPDAFAGAPGMILAVEAPAFNYIAEDVQAGTMPIPKLPIDPDQCLSEEEFREQVRKEMYRRHINKEE